MMNDCTLILFGATGDLAKRKIIPALYRLLVDKKVDRLVVVGLALSHSSVEAILEGARPFIDGELDQSVWQKLHDQMRFLSLDTATIDEYQALAKTVNELEKTYQMSGNRLAYLAVPATFFGTITQALAQAHILERQDKGVTPWHRIVYEKPFGSDTATAHAINETIARCFNEEQVYRIDHYLTKEVVSNIALIRFTNCVFEPLWNNRYIDQVHITLSETEGIENRGAYYDAFGALSDVVQNHMLQLLALTAMETPKLLSGDYVRDQRAKVLQKVEVVDGILGQYDGYRHEKRVNPDSTTETFAYLLLRVNNPRWAGVPFFLKTGKCLNVQETVINIKFKQVDCLLAKQCPSESNWLTIKVQPDATFYLTLNAKKPGYTTELIPVAMEFCHSCIFGTHIPTAYEILFEDVMRGEQASAVRSDEIEYAWRIIEHIKQKKLPLYSYSKGSAGPQELDTFMYNHGVRKKP
jgi:glucose-6-phosphate 1-dehydrogenase